MDDKLMEKLVIEHPELKWYIDIVKINENFEQYQSVKINEHSEQYQSKFEETITIQEDARDLDEFIKTIPENERDLYVGDPFFGIKLNWPGICCKLFDIDKNNLYDSKLFPYLELHTRPEDIKIPLCNIPTGIREFFEVDNQGNPTGNFNWDYVMSLNDLVQNVDNKEHPITIYFPQHAGLILENLDNPRELCEILIGGGRESKTGVDLNCPFHEIRDDKSRMLDIIRVSGDDLDSVNFWELASDRLKNDSDFIQQVEEIVGEEIFGCIAEFEGVEPEDILQRGKEEVYQDISTKSSNAITDKDIIQANQQLDELEKLIELKRQEIIKTKLKYIKENEVSELSTMTEQEIEQLINYLSSKGNPASTLIRHEWQEAYYPEDSGYDFDEYKAYVRLGDNLYNILSNEFIDPKELEEDYSLGNPEDMEDYRGLETVLGNKDALTEELDIDSLFETTRDIDIEEAENEEEFYEKISGYAHKKIETREKNEQAKDLYEKYEGQMPSRKGPSIDD